MTVGYHEYSIILWRDILARFPDLPRDYASRLNFRLARSHVTSMRLEAKEGMLGKATVHLLRALVASPAHVVRTLFGRPRGEDDLYGS